MPYIAGNTTNNTQIEIEVESYLLFPPSKVDIGWRLKYSTDNTNIIPKNWINRTLFFILYHFSLQVKTSQIYTSHYYRYNLIFA